MLKYIKLLRDYMLTMTKRLWQRLLGQRLLVGLFLGFSLAACSTSPTSVSGGYIYTDSWWYDDYWYYQDHIHPHCCHNDDEFKDSVEAWWHTLDPEQQAEIKDKVENWKEGHGPDIPALKADFEQKWQSLPEDKQQQITEKRQQIQAQMTGDKLSTEQKEAVKAQWQTKERPTLQQRPQIKRPNVQRPRPMPVTRPAGLSGRRGGNLHR